MPLTSVCAASVRLPELPAVAPALRLRVSIVTPLPMVRLPLLACNTRLAPPVEKFASRSRLPALSVTVPGAKALLALTPASIWVDAGIVSAPVASDSVMLPELPTLVPPPLRLRESSVPVIDSRVVPVNEMSWPWLLALADQVIVGADAVTAPALIVPPTVAEVIAVRAKLPSTPPPLPVSTVTPELIVTLSTMSDRLAPPVEKLLAKVRLLAWSVTVPAENALHAATPASRFAPNGTPLVNVVASSEM